MPNRYISGPLDDLLLRSGLTAEKVDDALERLARMNRLTHLHPGHAYLRRIRQHTHVRVVSIHRRYHRLLVQIEHIDNNRVAWQYFERSRTNCVFNCPGNIPHTYGSALIGRPLSALAIPTPALGAVTIDNVEQATGWLDVEVTPVWRTF